MSSVDQNSDRLLEDLKAHDVEKLFVDKVSGKNTKRLELKYMLAFVREDDELYVHSLDRLARNLADLLNLMEELTDQGVSMHFLGEKLDFNVGNDASPTSRLMLSMIGAFAEFERLMIKRRQVEGIALAKARGAYKGRQRSVTDEQIEFVRKQMALGMPLSVAVRKVGISRATAYKCLCLLDGEQF